MSIFFQQLCAVIIFTLLCVTAGMVFVSLRKRLETIANHADSAQTAPRQHPGQTDAADQPRVGFFRHWMDIFGEGFGCLKLLVLRVTDRQRLQRWGIDMLIATIISVIMCMYCTHTEGGGDLYMTTFIPILLFVLGVMFLLCETMGGSRVIAICCTVLILTGVALSVLLHLSPMAAYKNYHIDHPSKTVTLSLIAVYAAIFLFPFLRGVCRSERRTSVIVILNLMLIALYVLVLTVGKEINNAKAWLQVGPIQFQVSEVTKTLAFVILALELTHTRFSPAVKCTWATVTLVVNIAGLVLMNEFGTLLVVGLVYLALSLIYLPKLRPLLAALVLLLIVAIIGLLICRSWYFTLNPEEDPSRETTAATEAAEQETVAPTTAPTTAEGEPAPTEPAEDSLQVKILKKGAHIYDKFQDRFNVMINSEEADQQNEGYQVGQAKAALMIADWGPSRYEVIIPEAKSDFIFAYLLLRMGIIFGFVTLIAVLLMLCAGISQCLANPLTGEASVAVAFLIGISFQALVAAASATGNFITIGIPFAFVAYGGSTTMMNYTMLLFILYASRSEALVQPQKLVRHREKPIREEV